MKHQNSNPVAETRSSIEQVVEKQKGKTGETLPEQPGMLTREIGGREGPDPVRYGDWEKNGRCIDF